MILTQLQMNCCIADKVEMFIDAVSNSENVETKTDYDGSTLETTCKNEQESMLFDESVIFYQLMSVIGDRQRIFIEDKNLYLQR